MTKYEYVNIQAKELVRLEKKKKKINERIFSGDLSYKQTQKIHDELTSEYKPSGWHTYSGLRKELENLKFD